MKRNFKILFTLVMIVSCMIFSSFSVFATGSSKPEYSKLNSEASYTLNGFRCPKNSGSLQGLTGAKSLFDGDLASYGSAKAQFWYSLEDYVDITVDSSFNLWAVDYQDDTETYNNILNVKKWDGSEFVDYTKTIQMSPPYTDWQKILSDIPAGRYKIEYLAGRTIHTEWYIEGASVEKKTVLDIEPEKEKIRVNEEVTADLTIDNITEIAAEDIRIKYDNEKLKFVDFEEVDGIKLVKDIKVEEDGELRVILASKGEVNIVNAKKALLKLKFKGIKPGEAKVDITKGRVSDGIEMEKDLTDEQCDEGIIIIEAITDVNNSGEFTLLDLGIDARHLSKDPKVEELSKYNTDIAINDAIDEDDLLEIGKLMIDNPNYEPNKY